MRCALSVVVATACAASTGQAPPSPARTAFACPAGLSAASRTTLRGVETWCRDDRGVRSGPFERRFPRGQLAERGRYAAGVLDGDYALFHANGSPHLRGRYVRGLRDGAWRAWHDNGKPWLEVSYAAGRPVGTWLEYDYTGTKMFEGRYRDGRLDGEWRAFDPGGRLRATGASVDGQLDGLLTRYGADGSRLEEHFRNNRMHGTLTVYRDGKAVYVEEFVDGVSRAGHAP
ncbi:MAG TPA: hypothetical protein VGD37_34010 [Kofleriaceae bacterium]